MPFNAQNPISLFLCVPIPQSIVVLKEKSVVRIPTPTKLMLVLQRKEYVVLNIHVQRITFVAVRDVFQKMQIAVPALDIVRLQHTV